MNRLLSHVFPFSLHKFVFAQGRLIRAATEAYDINGQSGPLPKQNY